MRLLLRFVMIMVLVLVLGLWVPPPRLAHAANQDTTADRVIGQADFSQLASNNTATSLNGPWSAALDAHGNLYPADYGNNRVLKYDAPLTTGAAASRVFGQPDFGSNAINNGGVSAASLYGAWGVALDAQGNLYVADTGNSRLLEYDWALAGLYLPLARR